VDFDDLQLAKTFGPMKAYGPFGALQHSLHARSSRANSPAVYAARAWPPIACIPASAGSPRASSPSGLGPARRKGLSDYMVFAARYVNDLGLVRGETLPAALSLPDVSLDLANRPLVPLSQK
jgi:hypothetical protein